MRVSHFLALLGLLVITLVAGTATVSGTPTARLRAPRADTLTSHDPIARLQARLDAGQEMLPHDTALGYLPGLLRALRIPASSQGLVFSRTSLQVDLISPATPRALYFNDDVYIGYVRGSDFLEIATVSPQAGIAFYTLQQEPTGRPAFARETRQCLMCHQTRATNRVPAFMMLSSIPDREGYPITGVHDGSTTDATPVQDRFGGWYVTGSHGVRGHSGNAMSPLGHQDIPSKEPYRTQIDLRTESQLLSLSGKFDSKYYLRDQSDIVALMVLVHQTSVHTLINALDRATKDAQAEERVLAGLLRDSTAAISADSSDRFRGAVEDLVRGLFFVDEARLNAPIRGTTTFVQDFEGTRQRDARGRSLRQLDLDQRLFKYPLSFLVYSEAFDSLPSLAKRTVYRRIRTVLAGRDPNPVYARIAASDRQAILEILMATKPEFAAAERFAN